MVWTRAKGGPHIAMGILQHVVCALGPGEFSGNYSTATKNTNAYGMIRACMVTAGMYITTCTCEACCVGAHTSYLFVYNHMGVYRTTSPYSQ